jgi:LPXTG-motif cell wall-anchored protein
MKKIHIILITALLIAVLIPAAVSAAGVFYCDADRETGGAGTWANPWACATDQQTDDIVNTICLDYYGGHLYRIFDTYYVYYRIVYPGVQERCNVTSTRYPGYPPNTGVELPMPLMLGGGAAIGLLLVGAGVFLRRGKKTI